jgi:ribosomal protein S18 acetylase RimI-like enzyme
VAGVLRRTGRWIGLACGAVFDDLGGRAFVFSVYITPDLRGRGVADDLLQRVEQWARQEEHPALFLYVHQDNARAVAFYQRRGYQYTDARVAYPLDPSQYELEMRLPLQ